MNLKSIADWIEDHTIDVAEDAAGGAFGELEKILHTPLYPITDYHFKVSDSLWRGSWPVDADLEYLKAQGVKTAINLCAERKQDSDITKYGLISVDLPVVDNEPPTLIQASQFLDFVQHQGPVYVHCEQGKGRTGCMVAAYRILAQKCNAVAALHEAVNFGLAMPEQQKWILALGSGSKNGL